MQRPGLGLECNDLLMPVHDGTIGLNGPSDDIVAVVELDDDYFGLRGFINFLTDTEKLVGLERLMKKRRQLISNCNGLASETYAAIETYRCRLKKKISDAVQQDCS